MAKKIILFLSAMMREPEEQEYQCPDGGTVTGIQTNEAPVKYLLRCSPDIREILCILTKKADETAWDLFQAGVRSTGSGALLTRIDFPEKEDFTGGPLPQIMASIRPEDEIFLETTGGFRNTIMHLLLLSRVLSYTGAVLAGAVYSNYHARRVEDVSHLFEMFELVGGMQELTNLGSVRTLRKYYGSHPSDPRIDDLLTAMDALTEAITLCRTRLLQPRMEEFSRALESAGDCEDPLMRQLLPVFRRKFGKKMGTNALIKWCLDSDMLQQALTVYTERVPELILRRGDVVRVDDDSIRFECRDYEDRNMAMFFRHFLTMARTDPRCRDLEQPLAQIQTIEDLGQLLSDSPFYKAMRPVEDIQVICRDYLYIKSLRNMTNHAGGADDISPEILKYLIRCGYPDPDSVGMEDVRNILDQALKHLRPPVKRGKKH